MRNPYVDYEMMVMICISKDITYLVYYYAQIRHFNYLGCDITYGYGSDVEQKLNNFSQIYKRRVKKKIRITSKKSNKTKKNAVGRT